TGAKLNWSAMNCAISYQVKYRVSGGSWITVNPVPNFKKLKNLTPSTLYEWRVRTRCVTNPKVFSPYSPLQHFTTNPLKENAGDKGDPVDVSTYPNPFTESATIEFSLATTSFVDISLFDLTGR